MGHPARVVCAVVAVLAAPWRHTGAHILAGRNRAMVGARVVAQAIHARERRTLVDILARRARVRVATLAGAAPLVHACDRTRDFVYHPYEGATLVPQVVALSGNYLKEVRIKARHCLVRIAATQVA